MYNYEERRKQRVDVKELCSMVAWATVNKMPRRSLMELFKRKIRELSFADLMQLKLQVEQTPLLDLPSLLKRTNQFTQPVSLLSYRFLMHLGRPSTCYLSGLALLNIHMHTEANRPPLQDALLLHHADTEKLHAAEGQSREELLSLISAESGDLVEEVDFHQPV